MTELSSVVGMEHKSALFAGVGSYRVYKDPVEFTTVTASNVLEALKTSGLTQVYKVERYRPSDENVLGADVLQALLQKDAPVANAPADGAAPAMDASAPPADTPKN